MAFILDTYFSKVVEFKPEAFLMVRSDDRKEYIFSIVVSPEGEALLFPADFYTRKPKEGRKEFGVFQSAQSLISFIEKEIVEEPIKANIARHTFEMRLDDILEYRRSWK